MKLKNFSRVSLILFILFFSATIHLEAQKAEFELEPGQKVILDYPEFDMYSVVLKSSSTKDLEIKVLKETDDSFMSGFGLGPRGRTTLTVQNGGYLSIGNPFEVTARIHLEVAPLNAQVSDNTNDAQLINFTLYNSSLKSIPLLIPNVMNPNLSPKSSSGVSLEVGQEIYFREKGRKYILLIVDKNISEGQKINVPELIKSRKEELGL